MTLKSYFTPESLDEALKLKAEHGSELWVMAGGTIFMQLVNDGFVFPEQVMGLRAAGMDTVKLNGDVVVGAGTTMTQMTQLTGYPILGKAAQSVGGWAVRNMGTVGGNLFARAPYGDFAVALLALNASLKLQSAGGERTQSLEDFYANGRHLGDTELVTEIRIPRQSGRTTFHKQARRQSNAATIVAVAVNLKVDEGKVSSAAIALGGADQFPVRATTAESILAGGEFNPESIEAAAEAASEASHPASDGIASEWYRRKMIAVQLRRALNALYEGGT